MTGNRKAEETDWESPTSDSCRCAEDKSVPRTCKSPPRIFCFNESDPAVPTYAKKCQSWREYHCAERKEPAGGTAGCCESMCRRHYQSKEKDRRSGPHLFSFTLAMREAFIEFLQHFQRLLSSEQYRCRDDWPWSFALAVREAFVKLFQHFQRLLSLMFLSCPSGRLQDNTENEKKEIRISDAQ